MSPNGSPSNGAIRLLPQVTCPHCWERFAPDQTLWISEHEDLLGDPLLGPEQKQRFPPSRFTPDGDAIDAKGLRCHLLACPKCHLPVPRSMLEMEPLFLSILGAPSSGKSFFLTATTWELRRVLPLEFAISFSDADMASNRLLNACEESLFLNPDAGRLTPLGTLIRKTELEGELYDTVAFGHQTVSYPRPFLFTMQPKPEHPNRAVTQRPGHVLCLYDNAGEHFQPGQDTTSSPVTRHLARSRALLFLYDPTQDQRFLRLGLRSSGGALGTDGRGRTGRQELILNESIERVRRYAKLAQNEKHNRLLIIVLTKFDEWSHLLGEQDPGDPWLRRPSARMTALDVERIEQRSARLRDLMLSFCPETVTAAEGFAQNVVYIAISALGWGTQLDPDTGMVGIRPRDIEPHWVTAPLLYALEKVLPGLIPRFVRHKPLEDGHKGAQGRGHGHDHEHERQDHDQPEAGPVAEGSSSAEHRAILGMRAPAASSEPALAGSEAAGELDEGVDPETEAEAEAEALSSDATASEAADERADEDGTRTAEGAERGSSRKRRRPGRREGSGR